MAYCSVFGIISLIACILSCVFFCLSTSTNNWKEDIDVYKNMRKYVGLWKGCIRVSEGSYAKLPVYYECDKDFLRPKLVEPPVWFVSVRALMLLSCLGSGFGIFFHIVAIVTEQCKKSGSKYSFAASVNFVAGLCAAVGLIIFTRNFQMSVEYAYTSGKFYAIYWHEEPTESIVNGVFFKIETYLRWSYYMGWIGVLFSLISMIVAVLGDLIRKCY